MPVYPCMDPNALGMGGMGGGGACALIPRGDTCPEVCKGTAPETLHKELSDEA